MTAKLIWILLFILLAPVLGGLLEGVERRVAARMQSRYGPPILQPFYDFAKLWGKETRMVNRLQSFFMIGYIVMILFTGGLFFYGSDLLLVFFTLTLAGTFAVLAAYAANSPWSQIGGQRELVAMMSFEPMVLLAAIGFYVDSGSFSVSDILVVERPAIVALPGMFIGMVWVLLIETHRSPFDISSSHHMHTEVVSGLRTELSGRMLALDNLASWYKQVFFMAVIALFFVTPAWWTWIVALICMAIVFFILILIDNVTPRVRWLSMLKSTWAITAGAGLVNLFLLLTIGGVK